MNKPPFKKFIIVFLFLNKSVSFITDKLKSFGYFVNDEQISFIFNEIRSILPPSITELLNSGGILDIKNETHKQWLNQFEIFEFYDYILNRDTEKNPPLYFKWCNDCLWIHEYKDVMSLINILLFNKETIKEIVDIVSVKYKKKISDETLLLYKKMFWDTNDMNAKDALYFCIPFKNNTLIIKNLKAGGSEIQINNDAATDGSEVDFVFHDSNYIKWKIGYKQIEIPGAKDFIEQIKKDSFYKYYETMNMNQSVETEDEEGYNAKFGEFTRKLTKHRNVEEQRAKLIKNWIDIYLKANEAVPTTGSETKDFFNKMQELELDFGESDEEKIVNIKDA